MTDQNGSTERRPVHREGDSEEAELWLEVAFANAKDVDAMRLQALDHADLEPVWGQIGWV